MRVLITDSGYISGTLAAARSLHAAGWTVGVGLPRGRGFVSRSRAVARSHTVPSPEYDLDGFVRGLDNAIRDGGYEVILPSGDLEMLALSQERDRINARVPYGPHEDVVRALDKLDSTEAAAAAGLKVPWTRLADAEGLATIDDDREVIVKARRHTFLDRGEGTLFKVATVCRGPAEAAARARLIASEGGQGVVQERVNGRLVALSLVTDRGSRVVAHHYQVAERCWPEPVGGMARGFTAVVDVDLVARAEALLAELRWSGLAQLQFLLGPDDVPYFIDLNGRIYGSIALAIGSGIDLPSVWASVATERPPLGSGEARPGVRYQWFEADLKRAILGGPRSLPSAMRDAFAYSRGATHSVWSPKDPLPAIVYSGQLTRRLLLKSVTKEPPAGGSPPS